MAVRGEVAVAGKSPNASRACVDENNVECIRGDRAFDDGVCIAGGKDDDMESGCMRMLV